MSGRRRSSASGPLLARTRGIPRLTFRRPGGAFVQLGLSSGDATVGGFGLGRQTVADLRLRGHHGLSGRDFAIGSSHLRGELSDLLRGGVVAGADGVRQGDAAHCPEVIAGGDQDFATLAVDHQHDLLADLQTTGVTGGEVVGLPRRFGAVVDLRQGGQGSRRGRGNRPDGRSRSLHDAFGDGRLGDGLAVLPVAGQQHQRDGGKSHQSDDDHDDGPMPAFHLPYPSVLNSFAGSIGGSGTKPLCAGRGKTPFAILAYNSYMSNTGISSI